MRRRAIAGVSALALLGLGPAVFAATPSSGTVSGAAPSAAWSGSFLLSDPTSATSSLAGGPVLGCRTSAATRSVDPACDTFKITVVPPLGRYALELSLDGPDESPNDMDFFVFDSAGRLIGLSTSEFANERIVLVDLPAGTYDVVTEAWTVVPGAAYAASGRINTSVAEDDVAKRYQATPVPPGFSGVPKNPVVKGGGQALKLRTVPVGREAAEPTNGVRKDGVAFYAAGAFDALPSSSPANAARTEILRSKDGGLTWHSVQPILPGGVTTEPPTNLDPYVYVDESTGRVFSVDLYVGCAHMWYSDDAGDTWTRNPVACGDYVNDHQTFFSGPPPAGLTTSGYPNVL
ncbi:MAG TPA: hypothetical protein VFM29_03210, partial [Vicinamibacteria bacterium]|nr:hypothetical protein [Vicinamibacteria bacterium]